MEKIYDILIIGGGVGGMSAAIYAKRRGKEVAVIEKFAFGGQLNMINQIKNFPSHTSVDGLTLAKEFSDQVKSFDIEKIYDEVQTVDFSGDVKVLNGKKKSYQAKSVIIATGLKSKEIGVNENDYLGRGVSFCTVCDANFYKDKDVCVASANGRGLKAVKILSEVCQSVTLFDSGDLSAFAKVNTNDKVKVVSNATVAKVEGQNKVEKVKVCVGGKEEIFDTDALFVELGKMPSTDIFKNALKLDEQGFIVTNEKMQTSANEVYAIGDVRNGVLKQIVTACADGAIAGQNACQE
ncbi:MAG: NAD(P)/FAD-dependent oxidoreductase [Clostridia bacterium]|nr:NAD(P)/FAD-dependent oxidoreductase [Clostridia bacterium]